MNPAKLILTQFVQCHYLEHGNLFPVGGVVKVRRGERSRSEGQEPSLEPWIRGAESIKSMGSLEVDSINIITHPLNYGEQLLGN